MPWVALCAAACAALLASLWRGSALGVWLSKPVAAGAFVAAAVASGGLGWEPGRILVAALALSWLGDVLLIPSGTGTCFRAGMASFAAAHLAFSAAFLRAGVAPAPALAAGAALFALSDLSVARDRFVAPGVVNSLWGLPLYFGAQCLLALAAGPPAGALSALDLPLVIGRGLLAR